MYLYARPVSQLVKPQFVAQVESSLTKQMFWNIRLAIIGLLFGMLLYYGMLMADGGIEKHLTWFTIEFGVGIPMMVYFFLGENWIKSARKKAIAANMQALLIALIIGVGFFYQLPTIQNPNIKLTAFSLIIGVVGAAAFTFACNRFTFLLFSLPWLLPITFYFFFVSRDLGSMILGGMVVPYVGVLTFLCLKDYTRRVELIHSGLNLVEEKEQVVVASQKLQVSLDLVNKLKQQQDGDYYLTSLLLNPLGVNAAEKDSNVTVDFYTKQKKEFEFKSHKRRIGGDISIAHTLRFENAPVTVFLNADAMGKSMQGAGGALVLGAVFQSIIERSRQNKLRKADTWIVDVFLELQRVFESFDCSMLVSIFLCALENNSGKLYYLNAEHPWGVLYREGKAAFLQNRSYYRKLGTPGLQSDIQVDQMQLQAGDVILLGSDGRDDIELPGHEEGHRVINEDESIFLKHVETGDGRLEKIYELTASSGEITDDFSLVRIEYKRKSENPKATKILKEKSISELLREAKQKVDMGNFMQAAELLKSAFGSASVGPRALRAMLNLAMQAKDYPLAIRIAEKSLGIESEDAEIFYLAAVAERRLNRLEKSLEYAQRAYRTKKEPRVAVLNLLAELYISLKQNENARAILHELLEINPEDTKAKRMSEILG
ncbi:MAG: hypothetical protein LDLANPLL_02530 [Turneriella sp.]|nr:hypothetical protein [Turneriella sp.]